VESNYDGGGHHASEYGEYRFHGNCHDAHGRGYGRDFRGHGSNDRVPRARVSGHGHGGRAQKLSNQQC